VLLPSSASNGGFEDTKDRPTLVPLTGDMSCFVILAEARIQLSPYEDRIMIHRLQVLRPQLDARFREHDRYDWSLNPNASVGPPFIA